MSFKVLFVLDKNHPSSVDFVKAEARSQGLNFRVGTILGNGVSPEEASKSFASKIAEYKPDIIFWVGLGGAKLCRNIIEPSDLSLLEKPEGEIRGRYFKVKVKGELYESMHILHPASIFGKPSIGGLFHMDIKKATDKRTRDLRIKPGKCNLITKYSEAVEYLTYLRKETKSDVVALDTETKNVNTKFSNAIATFQFSDCGKVGTVIPWAHSESPWSLEEMKKLKKHFIRLFMGGTKFEAFLCHSAMFDIGQVYREFGVIPHQFVYDSYSALWTLDENRLELGVKGAFSLAALYREFGFDKYAAMNVKEERDDGSLWDLPLKKLAIYGASDAYGLRQAWECLKITSELQNYRPQFERIMKHYWSNVLKQFTVMRYNGAKIDIDEIRMLKAQDSPVRSRMKEIIKELNDMPSVKSANKMLLANNQIASKMNTFFGTAAPETFDINKEASKHALFFDVLRLEPTGYGKAQTENQKQEHCKHKFENDGGSIGVCTSCGATATGKLDKEFQTEYANVPEVALYTEYNQLKKLVTSYVDSLNKIVSPKNGDPDCVDGRIRCRQNPMGTLTARASTTNPNLAQLPRAGKAPCGKCCNKKGEPLHQTKEKDVFVKKGFLKVGDSFKQCPVCLGSGEVPDAKAKIKNLFVPEKGKLLTQKDYATAEVRGLGILSKDTSLAKVYNSAAETKKLFIKKPDDKLKNKVENESDIHKQTAALMWNVKDLNKVEKAMRSAAKNITFGLIYGMHVVTLAGNLGKTEAETQKLVDIYFRNYKEAKVYIAQMHKFAEKHFYVENPMGFRRRLWALKYGTKKDKARALRQSINSLVQGFCAQMAMLGLGILSTKVLDSRWDYKYGMTVENYVHDSVQYSNFPEYSWKISNVVDKILTTEVMGYVTKHFGVKFNLPIATDTEIGLKLGSIKSCDGSQQDYKKKMESIGFKQKKNKKGKKVWKWDSHIMSNIATKAQKEERERIKEWKGLYWKLLDERKEKAA